MEKWGKLHVCVQSIPAQVRGRAGKYRGRGRAQDQGSRRVRYQAPNQAAVPGQAQGRVDFLESVAPVES